MEHAEREDLAGDVGDPIGRRVLELLTSDLEEDDSADLWNLMRREVAEVFHQNVFRKATTLPQDILSVALCARGILTLVYLNIWKRKILSELCVLWPSWIRPLTWRASTERSMPS